jgi:hypothetical protein
LHLHVVWLLLWLQLHLKPPFSAAWLMLLLLLLLLLLVLHSLGCLAISHCQLLLQHCWCYYCSLLVQLLLLFSCLLVSCYSLRSLLDSYLLLLLLTLLLLLLLTLLLACCYSRLNHINGSFTTTAAAAAAHLSVGQLLLLCAEQVPVQRGVLEQPRQPSRHHARHVTTHTSSLWQQQQQQ